MVKKKIVLITVGALNKLLQTVNLSKLFSNYNFYIPEAAWNRTLRFVDIENSKIGKALFKYWWDWSIWTGTLEELDKKHPDELYFCGTEIGEYLTVNKVLGHDMLLTTKQIKKSL